MLLARWPALGCLLLAGLTSRAAEGLPEVSVEATDNYASEQSAPGIENPGLFTFRRTGDATSPLTVRFRLDGTATPVQDYADLGIAIIFPAGAAQVTLPVQAVYTRGEEPMESVVLRLLADATYAVGAAHSAT